MSIILDKVNYVYSADTAYQIKALKNVNLKIEDGQFIGVIGHTGSGKSTLIQHLNGLIKATSGSIYFHGKDIYDEDFDLRELRNRVGLVFQYPEHQLFEVSVIEDVKYGPKNLGLDNLEIEMRSFEALKMIGIGDDLLDASPFALSGGQKRRVAIAGVLAMKPKILILDEPMAGLDPAGRDEILELLAKLHRENDMTILLVSHSMDDVAKYVDRMLVMNDGKIVLDGEPRKVFKYQRELEDIGLGVPQATNVIHKLNAIGAGIEEECITPKEAADAIYNRYMKGNK